MEVIELIGVPGLAPFIAHKDSEIVVIDLFLFVGNFNKPFVDRFEFRVVKAVAESMETGFEAVLSGMASEHNACLRYSYRFRCHHLVCLTVFQHAVLMNAGLVRECVVAYNGLVGLDDDAGEGRDHSACIVKLFGDDIGVEVVQVAPDFEGHHNLFERSVSGPLSNAVHRAFDLASTVFKCAECVGHSKTEVVMAVHTDDSLVDVFDAEVQVSGPALAELSQRFVGLQQGLHLDSAQIAAVIVAFVQHIRYEVPQNTFGITSPAVIISDNRGDCDSKSLLGYLLLRAVGVQSMVFQSDAHAHAMLGIALPGSGEGWNYDGVTWLATEMTAEGWPMGQMDPEMKEPFDWRAMVMAR